MGMTLQHITGLHARFTAHNSDQRSIFLHELPDTCICIQKCMCQESVPKEQEMFLQQYSVASIETQVTKTFSGMAQ
jgi:exonuclease III